ncbi:Ger(x)C family spore germination protein [Paenibacillus sp. J22TS3]|uniref:Ger(x)C family spore germination protein n=1 Tax=Paenibacillus sp. J22TS3 TaxID=2807192 RepID=UPI001B06E15F|nr:Ger(x)C family spore germination protein [Paenibacillus sp. J22TS3]GIP22846.1 putative spore germination protein YfkR [Paenibacillus sp. J22TS3]
MARVLLVTISLVMMGLLSGCWNRIELNQLGIVNAVGVDYGEDGWNITYQIVVPSAMTSGTGGPSGSTNQPAVHVFSVQAKTIHQAWNLSSLENPRRIFVAHNKVVVIGKEAAEHGINNLLDYYFRNPEPRETVLMLLYEGQASEIVKQLNPPEKLPGTSLSDIVDEEKRLLAYFPSTNVLEFALRVNSDSKGAWMPIIKLSGDRSEHSGAEQQSLEVYKVTSPPIKLVLSGLGIFQGDKFAGYFNHEEGLGLSWMTGQIRKTEIPFPCSPSSENSNKATFLVNSSKTKAVPVKEGEHYVMRLKVNIRGNLVESGCPLDLTHPEVIKQLETQLDKEIEKTIFKAWSGIQRLKVDAAGFADKVHRKFPSDWRGLKDRWPEELNRMKLDVQVQAKIRRPGLIQKSFDQLQKEKEKK